MADADVVLTGSDDMRSRTVTWTDPAAALLDSPGLVPDQMWSAFVGGDLPRPPVAELIGFDLVEVRSSAYLASAVAGVTSLNC